MYDRPLVTQFMSLTQRTPWLNYDSTTDWWLSAIIKISWWEDKKKFSLLFNSLVNSRLNRIFNVPLIRSIALHSPKNRFISLSSRFADLCEFNNTFPKLLGDGVTISGSGYPWPMLCASPRYTFKPPYIEDSCHWQDKTNKGHKMDPFMASSVGSWADPHRIYVLQLFFKHNDEWTTMT